MKYPVVWSPIAEDKYLVALRFWSETSLNKAVKLYEAVEKLVDNLGQFKDFCPPSMRKPRFKKCTVVGRYALIYKPTTDTIHIVDFLDNRRKPKY